MAIRLPVVFAALAGIAVAIGGCGHSAGEHPDADYGAAPHDAEPLDRPAVESIVRDYLLLNPDVIRDAMDPARRLASRASKMRPELLASPGVPSLGDPAGAVTVIEFFDYQCGYCKRSLDAVRAALAHPGVRVEMREYPFLGEGSVRAARAALAAARQDRYEPVHTALMEYQGEYSDVAIEALAGAAGADVERLMSDMESARVGELIEANHALARRLGVTGTPAFLVVGPERIEASPGAVDADGLRRMIAAAAGPDAGPG